MFYYIIVIDTKEKSDIVKCKIMDGNEACSLVSYYFSELAGIYPITPASPMAEYVDKWSTR